MNCDTLALFPDQNVDKRGTECTAETVADIVANIVGYPMDPGFTYAATLRLMGIEPTTAGADPRAGMLSAVAFGTLPYTAQTFDAEEKGELYEANFNNYTPEQKALALATVQKGILNLGADFYAIKTYLAAQKWGVSLTMKWYQNFNLTPGSGIVPSPGVPSTYTVHDVAVYGTTIIGNVEYLICKPWKGKNFGDHGYCYLRREIVNSVAFSAYGFDPNGIRWASIVGILLTRFPGAWPSLPALLQANRSTSLTTSNPPTMTITANPKPVLKQISLFKPMILRWAVAVANQEGAKPALNNPGNLKVSTLTRSWGAMPGFNATDGGVIAKFATPQAGMDALCNFLVLGCEDELRAFHQARTLKGFSIVYAGNPPSEYYEGIAAELGVTVDILIASFLD